ncbi:MAG: alpha-galactosidase [Kiritimatiellae bacterium]|nr:alpha-galactosidase [Kiritimatiellia bacterium]
MRTPPPPAAPRINLPAVVGARPGRPFLRRVATTGVRPIRFEAEKLPPSVELDRAGGVLRGVTPPAGRYTVILRAMNGHGTNERPFTIVAGETLALTPPMGWNHWYTHYDRVTDGIIRRAAELMVTSGMADHGYEYVSIDDCWMRAPPEEELRRLARELAERGVTNFSFRRPRDPSRIGPTRGADGRLLPNGWFPDMRGLTDYIHSLGLKAGIYTSPGPLTCAGYAGSYGHEELDVRTFVEWGFDLLKYDWCSYRWWATGEGNELHRRPYRHMGELLARADRDVLFNLCQYGMAEVWTWGRQVGGHSWRTTGDVGLERPLRSLPPFYSVALRTLKLADHTGPGGWNDPDYILIGWYGDARGERRPRRTTLTCDEQYAYMSLWALMPAPLFFSGDMERLNGFTLNVLCNPEIIAVNQDPLGRGGRLLRASDEEWVVVKPLEDGSLALGLFAVSDAERQIAVSWSELGVVGPQRVRDLWRQRDLGEVEGMIEIRVARHGAEVLRLTPVR